MKKQVKLVDTGLDLYLVDADNPMKQIGKATFEQEYHIKYKGIDLYFENSREWDKFVNEHFEIVRDHKLRIEFREIEKDVRQNSESREDIDLLGELETALMSILDSHGIKYDMDSIRVYISGEDLK